MREAFGTVMRQKLAIEAESHLVAFGDKDKFVPGGVGFPKNGELLRLQKRVEICGQFLFPIQILLSASTNLQIHHAGFALTERRRRETLSTPVGPNECWRNEYTLLNFLEKTQNIFLFNSFCRRDYSQNRVQGSYSKRTMVRNRNPMWARVIGFKDDMTSYLIYVRIPKVLAQHFDQIHTA